MNAPPRATRSEMLVRAVGVVLALGVVMATLLHIEQLRRSLLDAAGRDTESATRAVMLVLNGRLMTIERRFDDMAMLLRSPGQAASGAPLSARAAGLSPELLHSELQDPLVREAAIVGPDRRILASSSPGHVGRDAANIELAPAPRREGLHIGLPAPGRSLGEGRHPGPEPAVPPWRGGFITLSKAYATPDGTLTLLATIGVETLITEFRRLIPGEHQVIRLYRSDGRLIAGTEDVPADAGQMLFGLQLPQAPHGAIDHVDAAGKRWIVTYRSADAQPLVAEVRTDYRETLQYWRGELHVPLAIMAIFLMVIVAYTRIVLSAFLDRSRANRELETERHRLQGILDNAAEGIITIDVRGTILQFNRAAERIFGFTAADVIGQPLSGVIAGEHAAAHQSYLDRYLAHGEPRVIGIGRKLATQRRDGAPLDIFLSVSETGSGRHRLFTGIVRDITENERQAAELIAARDAAESAARAKSSFLAMMSHELRTPMTGILGMADLLAEAPGQEDQRRYVSILRGSAQSLLTVLNDILDFSKIEAGKLLLEEVDFDPNRMLEEIRELFGPAATARGNMLEILRPNGDLPALRGDPTRIRQVLFNLVGNAIKFTERGHVNVRAIATRRDTGDAWQLRLDVEDDGIGIAPEVLERLFMPFQQADLSTTRRFGGTGLGLTICRELAERMGGEITVASRPGQGSTFTVTLRLAAAVTQVSTEPDVAADGPQGTTLPLKILVAEDNAVNRILVSTRLRNWGHEVTLAENGRQAVDSVRMATVPFDVVLMDMQMPVLDGASATREIRGLTEPACLTPVVALTADAMAEFREQYMEAGLDDYLTKPIDWTALSQCLGRIARPQAPGTGTSAADTMPPRAPAAGQRQVDATDAVVIDHQRLRDLAADVGTDTIIELANVFLETAAEDFLTLRAARVENNAERLRRAAHSLKGAAGNLGFAALAATARQLEKAPPDRVAGLIARLEQDLVAVRSAVAELPERLAS